MIKWLILPFYLVVLPFRMFVVYRFGKKLDRWYVARRKGVSNAVALRQTGLPVAKSYDLMRRSLDHYMGRIDVLTYSGGKFSGYDFDSIGVVMRSLAYLYDAVPAAQQEEIMEYFLAAKNHSWGGVRRAAHEALGIINKKTPCWAAKPEESGGDQIV